MGFDTDTTWYHKSKNDFEEFKPFSHFGTVDQANMRATGGDAMVYPVHMRGDNFKRMRDTGDWSEKKLSGFARQGFDGVEYLNRYEGIPLDAIERAAAKVGGMDRLDGLSDAQFKKLVPEAEYSRIAFDPSRIRSVNAAFDPAKKNSANLLASNPNDPTTAAILALLTAQQGGQPQQ